jgi:Uncharacterized protein conserved in bacteria (DUF2188)
MATRRYVRPSGGRWTVLEEGHRRGTVKAATKKAAIAKARQAVRDHGGGEVRVLDAAGKMTDTRTVPASKRASRNGSATAR